MRESQIQSEIIHWLENNGWLVVKIIQTNKNGWPDLQIHGLGITIFIEVKTPTGKVSELQKFRHKQIEERGFYVIITSSLTHLKNEFIRISEGIQKTRDISNLN
jgi:Holliday junction resolvase-like predicted endonuclease